MPAHAPKKEQPKTATAAQPTTAPRAGHPGPAAVADRRPAAVAQRQMQEMINQSPRVQQAAAAQARIAQSPRQPAVQRRAIAAPVKQLKKPNPEPKNRTGLPDNLKAGVENLSGFSLDDVKVHRNSSKPAELQAHAYAQGTDIHLAPGQEKHLPHEAWHVVQQLEGRVKPTVQLKGKVAVNDEAGLEKEADVMGEKAKQASPGTVTVKAAKPLKVALPVQRRAVIQRREIPAINAALQVLLDELNALPAISVNSAVKPIKDRRTKLATCSLLSSELAEEVAEKGGPATPLAALDERVAEITRKEPILAAEIAAGQAHAPARTTGWGTPGVRALPGARTPPAASTGMSYVTWKGYNEKLATNQAERDSNLAERTRLTNERPLSVLQDKLNKITAKLDILTANLEAARMQCYFELMMTTQTPTMTTYKSEKPWLDGEPSVLGVFIFSGPAEIEDISGAGVGPIEVHIHFRRGTKRIKKAHIKHGWKYAGTDLAPGSPTYANTALSKCKAQITKII